VAARAARANKKDFARECHKGVKICRNIATDLRVTFALFAPYNFCAPAHTFFAMADAETQ